MERGGGCLSVDRVALSARRGRPGVRRRHRSPAQDVLLQRQGRPGAGPEADPPAVPPLDQPVSTAQRLHSLTMPFVATPLRNTPRGAFSWPERAVVVHMQCLLVLGRRDDRGRAAGRELTALGRRVSLGRLGRLPVDLAAAVPSAAAVDGHGLARVRNTHEHTHTYNPPAAISARGLATVLPACL